MKKINAFGILVLIVLFTIAGCKTNDDNQIELSYNEYEMVSYIENGEQINFSLRIISKGKLNILKNSKNPLLYININNKTITARGWLSVLSQLPEEGNYFFPVDNNGKIEFSENDIINFIGFEDKM
jgi:hypothetical protein